MIQTPRSLTELNAGVVAAGFQPAVGWALAQRQDHPRARLSTKSRERHKQRLIVGAGFQPARQTRPEVPHSSEKEARR